MTHTVVHRFKCDRCKRELTIAHPRDAEALDEEFRRAFPDVPIDAPRDEVCDDCYQRILGGKG